VTIAFLVCAAFAAAPAGSPPTAGIPFEITSNKPFVQVTLNGSAPQWFILDTGCAGGSVIAKECADRLGLTHGQDDAQHLGAGQGVAVGISRAGSTLFGLGADTLRAAEPRVFTLAHVSPYEGRRVDGLLGEDFLRRYVVRIDYEKRELRVQDPGNFVPDPKSIVVPITILGGLAVADGSVKLRDGTTIPGHFIIDTGVRTTLILFHPFAVAHGLLDQPGNLLDATVGGGAGGETRGDIGRLAALSLGPSTFDRPHAIYSRDTVGVFASPDLDGIVGGELLRHGVVTFDYPHERILIDPYPNPAAFDYDMSGLFLVAQGDDFARIVAISVTKGTPASEAGMVAGDEIRAIDGIRAPALSLERAREMLRKPGAHRLELTRDGKSVQVTVKARRLV